MTKKMRNRYGDEYFFEEVENNIYIVKGELNYWRFGGSAEDNDSYSLEFVDPSGGPFIDIGYEIEGKRVDRIFVKDGNIMLRVS